MNEKIPLEPKLILAFLFLLGFAINMLIILDVHWLNFMLRPPAY